MADRQQRFLFLQVIRLLSGQERQHLQHIIIWIFAVLFSHLQRIAQKLIQYFRERLIVKIVRRSCDFRPAADYSDDLIQSAKDFSDTAVIVLSRVAGEGHNDMPGDVTEASYDNTINGYNDFEAGEHYLQLSQTEEDLVDLVCRNFDNVILVYNAANPMELGFIDEYEQIRAAIWCQGPGHTGFEALGKILSGEVNPSGKTTDTFIYDMTAAPWWNNWEGTHYSNMEDMAVEGMNSGMAQTYYPSFTNYVEGIYVGYKYYETADVEGVIDYDTTVQYPLM